MPFPSLNRVLIHVYGWNRKIDDKLIYNVIQRIFSNLTKYFNN